MGPALPYSDVVTALHGADRLPRWLELAEVLEPAGWRFTLNSDGLIFWEHAALPMWAAAERDHLVLYRGGRHPDDAAWWELAGVDELLAEVERHEAGRHRYATRTGGSGRWEVRPLAVTA